MLLKEFKSLKNITAATTEELQEIGLPKNVAQNVLINYIRNEERALYKESKVSYHFMYNKKSVYVLLVNNKSLTSGV